MPRVKSDELCVLEKEHTTPPWQEEKLRREEEEKEIDDFYKNFDPSDHPE